MNDSSTATLQLWVQHHCSVMPTVAVTWFQYRIMCFILYSHMRST